MTPYEHSFDTHDARIGPRSHFKARVDTSVGPSRWRRSEETKQLGAMQSGYVRKARLELCTSPKQKSRHHNYIADGNARHLRQCGSPGPASGHTVCPGHYQFARELSDQHHKLPSSLDFAIARLVLCTGVFESLRGPCHASEGAMRWHSATSP
jgi:hypothetical protein